MISRLSNISAIKMNSSIRRTSVLCCALLMMFHNSLFSQVISNRNAVITVKNETTVVTKDAENTGSIENNGTIKLTGNWLNSGNILSGSGTVTFNGDLDQLIQRAGGESFNNLTISNTGGSSGKWVRMPNNVFVNGILSISNGNINVSGNKLYLTNSLASALDYTSLSGSRIFGRFERGISQQGTYLFPSGTLSYYNPANITINNVPTSGSVAAEFISAAPGNNGMPFPDPPVEVFKSYVDGYWHLVANGGFSVNNFSVNLTANGFADTIFDVTRVVRRNGSGDWRVDGSHVNASGQLVLRNNLTGNISPSGTDFALARIRPLITVQPMSQVVCEQTNPVFSITATGTAPLTYIWYKDGVAITAGLPKYGGHRSNTLTIFNAEQSDEGTYYCVVRDRDRNITTSNPATLIVNEVPVATITNGLQPHECSDVAIENMQLNISYGVPGTTFFWSRTNTSAVVTGIPLSGTSMNIGDAFSGSFTNITDAPVEIIFTITPVGPAPTSCIGLPIEARIVVNPTPRAIAENMKPEICYNGATQVKLTSPSIMTMGTIQFDYTINVPASPAIVAGNRLPANSVPLNQTLSFQYTNESDTLQSVFFNVTPKVVGLSCPAGLVIHPEVKVHAKPLQSLIITTPLTCEGGSNAALRANTSEGAGPLYFDWVRTTLDQIHGVNIPNIVNQKGGRWDLTVTDNLNCKSSGFIFVEGAFLDSYLYVVDTTGYGTTCPGSNDAELWLKEKNSSTGIAPFEYWIVRNSQDTVIHNVLPSIDVLHKYDHLLPGDYRLFIRDANGCYNNPPPEVVITEPGIITPEIVPFTYPGGKNVSCRGYNDGSVKINSITGGNGGYKYEWHTINGHITGPDSLDRLDNVTAGTYYLTTTDRKGCSKVDSITLVEPAGMELVSYDLSNISCNAGSNGSIEINITGGSGNYVFNWAGPGGFSATSKNISGLKAGTYTVLVTDQNNSSCSILPQPVFTLTEPPLLTVDGISPLAPDGVNQIRCNGGTGSVNITVNGGTGGTYIYNWTTSDGSGITDGIEDQSFLTAGTYKVVVIDSNNCTAQKVVMLTEPERLDINLLPTNISCQTGSFDNGSVELLVSGGSSPYSFLWSNGSLTKDISNLTEGYYKVTVTDINGCQVSDSARINLPEPLTYTRTLSNYNGFNISCNGLANGSINVSMTGGTAPFIYSWTGPDGFSSGSKDISNLPAGQYNLVIRDSNFCSVNEIIELTEPGPLGLNISLSTTGGGYNIGCAGGRSGTISVEPVNATGFVDYLWADGIFGKNRDNLHAGEYRVIIKDENNCYSSSTITLTQPDSLKINFDVTEPFCPDKPNGEIRLSVTGGVPAGDYIYLWSDNSTGRNLSEIDRGHYKVTVSDMNGCTARDSVFVDSENETCLIIPNAISPNDDLVNDYWNIGEKELYPSMEVKVFNRWGEAIWRSEKGYPHPWDGRSKGAILPIDSYHYIIDLHNGSKPIVGNVTIIK